jgi:hypothetical protein
MPIRWAVANGNWSNTNTWNSGSVLGIPTGSDDVWSNNFNVNIDQSFDVVTLRNTTRARDIATPAMTANNAPSPYVAAASTINSTARDAWTAFDRVYTTTTGWQATSATSTGWLSMDFGSGSSTVIDGYTIFGTSTQAVNPRNWSLQGSDDNNSWTNLHIVSGAAAIAASSTYSVASIGNSTGYRYYRVNITLNGGTTPLAFTELELYQPGTITLSSGGSFIFNSGSISGSVTSTTQGLFAGATNLIQVTAATGSVTLSLGSAVTPPALSSANLINHSGNCNFNLNGTTFNAANNLSVVSTNCISKSSTGTITIVGDLIGSTGGNQANLPVLNSTNGNTVVIGNVRGGTTTSTTPGINQTAGNVTITGNVTAQNSSAISLTGAASQFTIIGNVTGGTATSAFGINHSGTSGSVTGTVTGGAGSGASGITTSGVVTVTGNVNGGSGGAGIGPTANITIIGNVTGGTVGSAISTASNISITVTGTATAGTVQAISSTSTGTVNLSGNMINVGGRQAIYSQNLFISNTTTSQWRLFTPGSQNKTLYSSDTFPNLPSSTNVRSGSVYGVSNTLSGSMVVPSPSDVRINVPVDNTVGTGTSLTAADFLNEISSSNTAVAQRLRNIATDDTVGSLLTGFNNGGF